jgi:hypothetical protein
MGKQRKLMLRRLLREANADLREAERYIQDLHRLVAKLEPGAALTAFRAEGIGRPVCARCHGRKTEWTLQADDSLLEQPCQLCEGTGEPLGHETVSNPKWLREKGHLIGFDPKRKPKLPG